MPSANERAGEAIGDVLFDSSNAGRPVYTLGDSEQLNRIRTIADLSGDAVEGLAEVVRTTLSLDDPGVAPFRLQADLTEQHRAHPLETPPALPLLVILTLAAERMQADHDFAAHNYYARLHSILRVPLGRQPRVEEGYRRHAQHLWGSLNAWLEAWEGERGVPTAYAIGGHAFVGLPMSQAVVRQHDRIGLHEFFALEGMSPGLRMAPSDMEPAMDSYATTTPSPLSSNLRRLWIMPAARERIVEAACLELEAWDGSGQATVAELRPSTGTRLLAFLRTFPRRSIEFNLLLPYRSVGPEVARFEVAGREIPIPTIPAPGSATRLASTAEINSESLAEETIAGYLGQGDNRRFERRPRRVVPLRWDDLQGAYVEVERISLGEDTLVLARADAKARVEAHLISYARPNWGERSGLSGVPDGWLIYEHVQMVSGPTTSGTHLDLVPLVPRARTSLTLRGGFVLPGLLRKWSSVEPPEAIGLAAGASSISLKVYEGTRVEPDHLLIQVDTEGELAVLPLAGQDLEDGEFVVAMFVDGARRPASTALLRLRSADTPQFSVDDMDIRLVYSSGSSLTWPLSAGPAEWPAYVNGARVVGGAADSMTEAMSEYAPRLKARPTEPPTRISVGVAMAADSCMTTGMHRFQFPPATPDQRRQRTIEGECVTCGLVKRSAGTPWAARRRDEHPTRPSPTVEIPPISNMAGPDFQVAFDALNHVGHGSYAVFERIAAQIEGSGLFADSFLRRQEAIGHIDVARDSWLQVTEWAVNSATLVPTAPGCWVLIGARSRKLLQDLRAVFGDEIRLVETVDAETARIEIQGDPSSVALLKGELAAIDVALSATPPAIAAALPPIGEVAAGLKRIVIPRYRGLERWDTGSASWESASSLASVGAFRLKDFRSTYVVRSSADIANDTVAIGNAQLVKHVANMWAADPLAGYHSASGSVVVPLGADLPGLYGRALAVCSGRAPRELVSHRMLQYPSVPRHVADAVFARLAE